MAQAAWIYQMFQDTCGTPGNAEGSFTFDQMLDDIMLYWLPNTGASSARLYWERVQTRWSPPASLSKPITLPTGPALYENIPPKRPAEYAMPIS